MLDTIIIGALVVLGIYAAMGEGMILERLRLLLENLTNNKVLSWVRPALYECPICMASIWGSSFWFLVGNTISIMWPLYILGVAGFNYVAINLIHND